MPSKEGAICEGDRHTLLSSRAGGINCMRSNWAKSLRHKWYPREHNLSLSELDNDAFLLSGNGFSIL